MIRLPALYLLTISLFASGCDSAAPENSPPPNSEDEIVAEVNLTELFRIPSISELDTVRDGWSAADAALEFTYSFTVEASLTGSDGAEINVYAGRDAQSNNVLFYGLVRLPLRPPGDVAPRPLLLVLPDEDVNISEALLTDGSVPIQPHRREDFVYALMAYRGETLHVGETTFSPETQPSPYSQEDDDALAFVSHVMEAELLVNDDRIGVLGESRGGNVALLAASRTNSFDIAISLAAPSNLFLTSFRNIVRRVLNDQPLDPFPDLQALSDRIILPLREEQITQEEARLDFLSNSPAEFVSPPPFLFIAHGAQDFVVGPEHSRSIGSFAGGTGGVYLEVPDTGHENLTEHPQVIAMTTTLLTEHLVQF